MPTHATTTLHAIAWQARCVTGISLNFKKDFPEIYDPALGWNQLVQRHKGPVKLPASAGICINEIYDLLDEINYKAHIIVSKTLLIKSTN